MLKASDESNDHSEARLKRCFCVANPLRIAVGWNRRQSSQLSAWQLEGLISRKPEFWRSVKGRFMYSFREFKNRATLCEDTLSENYV